MKRDLGEKVRDGEARLRDAPERELHLLELLAILAKRRRLILLSTAGAAVLAAIVMLLEPNQYTATTTIMPPAQSTSGAALLSQLGGAGMLASAASSNLGIKNPGDMYVSLMHSRTLDDSIIRRFGLIARYRAKKMSDARVAFEAHVKISLGAKDGLITVSVTDRDPRQAAEIANGIIEEFQRFSANLAITEASQRRVFFEQQLREAKGNLAAAEEAMKGVEQSTGVLQIDSQTRALIESAAALRAQVVAKEVQLQGMRSYATEDNPEMLVTRQQLAALQDQLGRLTGTGENSGPNSSDDSGLMVPEGRVPGAELNYIRKLRDVKYYDAISELIAKQFEMAKLDEARQGAVIQVVDLAVPPDKKSSPHRTMTVMAVAMLGLFAACGWCIVAEAAERLQPRLQGAASEPERCDAADQAGLGAVAMQNVEGAGFLQMTANAKDRRTVRGVKPMTHVDVANDDSLSAEQPDVFKKSCIDTQRGVEEIDGVALLAKRAGQINDMAPDAARCGFREQRNAERSRRDFRLIGDKCG
jgi:tyrosine-protein kinase Etk/Wzc